MEFCDPSSPVEKQETETCRDLRIKGHLWENKPGIPKAKQ